jgi:hypothetical protein
MRAPEKMPLAFMSNLFRTAITAAVITLVIYFAHVFPQRAVSLGMQLVEIWLMVFSIVFFGHWLELLFINHLKFALPKNLLLLYVLRIAYWFLCAIPLFYIANFIGNLLTGGEGQWGYWWEFGIIYTGIELFMHALMQLRFKKSFYNGAY